eukprot:2369856-Amphidinium_carterae.1
MRQKAKDCGKPSLLRMGYDSYPDQRSWEHYTMPMAPWQADCLFCEFMPPADREEGWPAQLVNWGGPQWDVPFWDPCTGPHKHDMGDGQRFGGVWYHVSASLSRSVQVSQCMDLGLSDLSPCVRGWTPRRLCRRRLLPNGVCKPVGLAARWASGPLHERHNLIASWFLCAICLQKWSSLSQAAWHCVGSLFNAPLTHATTEIRTSILPGHWKAGVQQVDWNFNPKANTRQPGWPAEGRPLQMLHSLVAPVEPPVPPETNKQHRAWEDWLDCSPNSSQIPMPHFGRDKRPARASPQQMVVHDALRAGTHEWTGWGVRNLEYA